VTNNAKVNQINPQIKKTRNAPAVFQQTNKQTSQNNYFIASHKKVDEKQLMWFDLDL
jgi:hypothetical protein